MHLSLLSKMVSGHVEGLLANVREGSGKLRVHPKTFLKPFRYPLPNTNPYP